MDAATPKAAAIIREGDPSQSRPNNTEVKVDTADVVKNSEGTSKSNDISKGTEKKKKNAAKKKQSDTSRLKKDKRKKKKVIATESSSDSSDDSTEDSDSSGEPEENNTILRKRAVKKPQDVRKTKLPDKVKGVPCGKVAAEETDSDSSVSDSETDDEEEEEEANAALAPRTSKKNHGKGKGQGKETDQLAELVAKIENLQRLVSFGQFGQTQYPQQTPWQSQNGGIGTGLGGVGGLGAAGFDGVLNNLPPLPPLFPNTAGRSTLNSHTRDLFRNIGRTPPAKNAAGLAGLDDGQDPLGDPIARLAPYASKKESLALRRSKAKNAVPEKLDYKRVDQVWDNTIHNFKLQDTAKFAKETKYDGFCFHVRRTFDWEGKYKSTVVDIKSKLLRECLQDVIGNIKGVSLVDETPKLDPNVLFL